MGCFRGEVEVVECSGKQERMKGSEKEMAVAGANDKYDLAIKLKK